jgi:hypothetical protein
VTLALEPDADALPPLEIRRFVLMQTLPQNARLNSADSRYNIVHSFLFA